MTGTKVIDYVFAKVLGEERKSDEFEIKLPPRIFELEPENVDFVHLQLRGDDPQYLAGVRSTKDGTQAEGYYNVSNKYLELGEQWKGLFPRPLHQVGIEIDKEANTFRIYDALDFVMVRIPELLAQGYELNQVKPIAATGLWEALDSPAGAIDLAAPSSYPGQRVRLIPYDAQHEVFQEATFRTVDGDFKPRPSLRRKLTETDRLPRYQPQELTIEWDPSGRLPTNAYPVFKAGAIKSLKIILPAKGYYSFTTRTSHGTLSTAVEYRPDDRPKQREEPTAYAGDGWWGHCLEAFEANEHLTAYLPCQTTR